MMHSNVVSIILPVLGVHAASQVHVLIVFIEFGKRGGHYFSTRFSYLPSFPVFRASCPTSVGPLEVFPQITDVLFFLSARFTVCVCVCVCVCVLVTQSCPTLGNPMDCSLPHSSVHGILQTRILEWVAFCFSRGPSSSGTEPRSPTLQADSSPSEPRGKLCWIVSLLCLQAP